MQALRALDSTYGKHLGKDPVFRRLLQSHPVLAIEREAHLFYRLCRSILGQQLSVKVADLIESRFLDHFKGQRPAPRDLMEADTEGLRSLGLSYAKIRYLKAWAKHALATGFHDDLLYAMDDDQVRDYLMPVPGIGPWTVDMVLLFSLGRADVWPMGDLGIRMSIEQYFSGPLPKGAAAKTVLEALAAPWSPFRSYAALHLWYARDHPLGAPEFEPGNP